MVTKQRTLIIFKPDVVQRQIVGELLTRFEKKGYKIVGMKLTQATRDLVGKHYEDDPDYLRKVGEYTIIERKERGVDVSKLDPVEVGAEIRLWNMEYLSCGPVIAIVLEGALVIENVRKLAGKSNPIVSDVGTIRADYSPDAFVLANEEGRATRTLIHASDSEESAKREIALWFNDDELFNYETAIEKILYDKGWVNNK
ncbi:nucleoside-diphosphate kinase [Candidatus Dojkabacteria bacterium]|nr:nucleoside-diphosphate kinase [Candidatus Dojkabacteria bacterium]